MERKRKEPLEIEVETSEENESPELTEDPVSLSEEIEEAPAEEVKPKRRRQRRKRKAAEPVATEIPAVEPELSLEPATETVALPVAEATATPDTESPDAIRQWKTIQTISSSICSNLERVNTLVKEMPDAYGDTIQCMLKTPAPKASPLAKAAAAMSGFAVLLSILSFSFSQAARRAALDKEVVVAAAPAPRRAETPVAVKPHTAPAAASSAPIAVAPSAPRRIAPAVPLHKRPSVPARR